MTTIALDATLERAMLGILRARGINYRAEENAPDTLERATVSLHALGLVVVDNANSAMTIWSSPEMNYAFRAWHDWHHVNLQAEFNDEGERRVHSAMVDDLLAWLMPTPRLWTAVDHRAVATLEAENVGQLAYWARVGHPPVDQRTFAEGYLAAKGLL